MSTNLARERLQIDTDLLHIITSTADEHSGAPTLMTFNDLKFSRFEAATHIQSEFSPKLLKIDQGNLRTEPN